MARIVGVNLPLEKRVEVGLTYIYGIGLKTSQNILSGTKIDPNVRVKDLNDIQVKLLNDFITKSVKVEGELKQIIFRDIKRLKDIKSFRGLRHKVGLPVRGQNTRKNARTRKGRSLAVGGLKRKLDKK